VRVPAPSIIQVQELREEDNWKLFCLHTFRHSDGILPTSIDEETTRLVFNKCGGLPLDLKVIGQAMAGVTKLNEWKFSLKRLQNAEIYSDLIDKLFVRLRLSYDALADFEVALQLCFLYLSSFPKDEVIFTRYVSQLWIGEGFLDGQDPLQIGK
ncbi:hypothetical protein KI387_013470, partial [Taxus chinensis]